MKSASIGSILDPTFDYSPLLWAPVAARILSSSDFILLVSVRLCIESYAVYTTVKADLGLSGGYVDSRTERAYSESVGRRHRRIRFVT